MIIKQFINIIEQVYEENFTKNYMPEQLGISEQLVSIIRQLGEQEEELIYDELAVETLDTVIEGIKKYHDVEDVLEMLEVNVNELEDEVERKYD